MSDIPKSEDPVDNLLTHGILADTVMSRYPRCVVPLPGSIHLENIHVYPKTIHKSSIYNSHFYTKYIRNPNFAQIRQKKKKKQSHTQLSSIMQSRTRVNRLYLTNT